jgi:hypothetical protein
MAKAKKTAKAAKSDKDKLAAGAAEIKKAQSELKKGKTQAVKPEPVEIPESTRPMEEIIRERVTIAPGSIGLTLADDTPIEETLRVLDWTTSLSDHVGFMIGDVLNFGAVKWGDKYKAALDQTNRALSTLKGYAEASRRIPMSKRVAALSFSHHREILRLPDEKMDTVLTDLGKEADKKDGHVPTRDELRIKIQKLTPRKRKPTQRVTSGKGKGKKVAELPPYEPTDTERELLEEGEMAVDETAKLLKPEGKLFKVLVQLDNKEKQRWLSKLDSIVLFFKGVQNKTGY